MIATALVVLAASLLAVAPAQAAPGDLDPTFSGDGQETTDFGKDDLASGVALQPDGKIVVAGSSRFEVVQCDDISGCGTEYHADSALARYNADGTLDTSFSDDGKQTVSFGDATYGGDTAYGVAIQPDGKIVVAGSALDPSGVGADDFALARFNPDGLLDTSFSDDGKQVTSFGHSDRGAYGLALQPDGKIVAVGATGGDDFAVARYNADGSLDTSFSDDGKQTTDLAGWDEGRAVAIQDDDKIVVAGTTNVGAFVGDDDFALARYASDGALDTTFSDDGKQYTNFGIREHDDARGIALQPDGKIVAVGFSTLGGDTGFALARYGADGSLDTSFSGDGKQHAGFGHTAFDVALQLDGKIVAVGSSGGGDFALARYEAGSSGGTAPANASPPAISGTATEGQTLTVSPGIWSGSTPINLAYQWRRCDSAGAGCADIEAATATSYTLTAADVGRTIRVRETATNAYGQGSVDSAATAVVKPRPGAIAGTVRGPNGSLAGASVNCGSGYSATTASDGTYSIPNVAPAKYSCTASANGYRPSTRTVPVTSGQTTTANFKLRR